MKIIETKTREEWLEARKGYLTATDIAALMTGGPAAWKRIKEAKAGVAKSIGMTQPMAFGHQREPEIASYVTTFADSRLAPNDQLCVSDQDQRLAATPDMLGIVDGVCEVIGEIKTTKNQWEEIPRNYWVQVQTQLFVTGAKHCVFAWEVHEDYVPGEIQTMIIHPNASFFEQIEDVVTRFFDESHDTDPWELLIDEYRTARQALDEAQRVFDEVCERMREYGGDKDVTFKSAIGSVTWKHRASNRLDEKKLLAEHPDLAQRFAKFDATAFKREEKKLADAYTIKGKARQRTLTVKLATAEETEE